MSSKLEELFNKRFDSLEKRLEEEDEEIIMNPMTRVRNEYINVIKLQREFIREGGDFFREMATGDASDSFERMATFGQEFFGSAKAAVGPLKDLAKNMNSFIGFSTDAREKLGKTTAVMKFLGFETKAVAEIMDSASLAYGENSQTLEKLGRQLATISRDMMVGPEELSANFREAQKSLAYNARKMMTVFKGLQRTSRLTGVSFSTLTNVFGEQMDTFEGSSKRAANLNAILGRGVFNSMDLLRKTETERLSTIVQGVRNNLRGSVNSLGKFELKGIAEGMGLSVEETRRLLLGKTSVAEALKKRAQSQGKAKGLSPEEAADRLANSSNLAADSLDTFKRLILDMRTPMENLKIAASGRGYKQALNAMDKLGTAFPGLADQLKKQKSGFGKVDLVNKALLDFSNSLKNSAVMQSTKDIHRNLGNMLYGTGPRTSMQSNALDKVMKLAEDATGKFNVAKFAAIIKTGELLTNLAGPAATVVALRGLSAQKQSGAGQPDPGVDLDELKSMFVDSSTRVVKDSLEFATNLFNAAFGIAPGQSITDKLEKAFQSALQKTALNANFDFGQFSQLIKIEFNKLTSSDRRLKENITKMGVSPSGITIYSFNYIWNKEKIYQGVMAQDLLGTPHEKAVILQDTGYYAVNYDVIDVEFRKLSNKTTNATDLSYRL